MQGEVMDNNGTRRIFSALAVFAALCAVYGCDADESGGTDSGGPFANQVFVVTTDYYAGSCSSIAPVQAADAGTDAGPDIGPYMLTDYPNCGLNPDAYARFNNNLVYVVNRKGGDNIQVLDPSKSYTTISQTSVGAGSNPQDIAFWKNKAYVSRMEQNTVWVMDINTMQKLREIDLSTFADVDGFCEPGMMATDGRYIYVSIMRLDRTQDYIPTDRSYVAMIDPATDKLVGSGIQLKTVNPWPGLSIDMGRLYVGTSGQFGKMNGGIEELDPVKQTSNGLVINAATLGGDISLFQVHNQVIYAVISDANFNTKLVAWDMRLSKLWTVMETVGFNLAGFAINSKNELWISDRDMLKPGVRVLDLETYSEKTAAPISTMLPPYMLLFME
jgi:hypothetical protein